MEHLITELTKYLTIILMSLYTYLAFRVIVNKNKRYRIKVYRGMETIMFVIHGSSFLSLYITTRNENLFLLYLAQVTVFIVFGALYRVSYKMMSQLVFRNMLFLLMIGFVMVTRLSFEQGVRQFVIASVVLGLCLIVPLAIEKIKFIGKMGWIFGITGLFALIIVLGVGTEVYGSKNWLIIGGFRFQPSEFVKLLFILFSGALLSKAGNFRKILLISIFAALHVIILVLSKDLGAALLFFTTYVIMLYASTKKWIYLLAGGGAGLIGAVLGYVLFRHVRVRVMAFLYPFELIEAQGYQICQSLFAIGTGGWFGMGLNKGLPTSIPVVESDFIFAAIAEELGGIFAVCIILICISCFIMFINISVKIKNTFYKLLALGFSTMYIVQVLLNVGGVLKCIPSTGVTLPLISYGGSSIVSSILMFSMIQGLYVLHLKADSSEIAIDDYESIANRSVKLGKRRLKKIRENAEILTNEERMENIRLARKVDEKHKDVNESVLRLTYIFSGLLFAFIGYYTYFLIGESKEVVNNSYNTRQDLLTEIITRGKIMSSDGKILAQTVTLEDGSEMRVYPYGNIFAHTVGRTVKGRTGLELSENYNLLASSISGFDQISNEIEGKKNPGDNVVSTLNAELSQVAYDALGDHKGAVVVLEPSTGKILTMVSKPGYNPNTITNDWKDLMNDKDSPFLNRAAQGLYQPGSTFKILTLLEYIREHPNYKNYEYTCKGEKEFNGVTLHCSSSHGRQNLKDSFANSCNLSFANLGLTLNLDSFHELCNTFLFNQNLPVSIPVSRSRFVLTSKTDSKELPHTVIGLGKTQITPLHNAMIVSAIANGGVLMKPYLVDYIESSTGSVVKRNQPKSYGSVLTAKEAGIITDFMVEVVKDGTASKLKDMSVSVAGKTGTAEYDTRQKSHAWFVGFAPANNPEIVISVIVETSGSGSAYAVPIAKELIKTYFSEKK